MKIITNNHNNLTLVIITIIISTIFVCCCESLEEYRGDSDEEIETWKRKPIRLLSGISGNTQLSADSEGFELLRSIKCPVSIVSFLGRARSGKSFTLNQLLGLDSHNNDDKDKDKDNDKERTKTTSCFKVGHFAEPKTRGAELWGVPIKGEGKTNNGTVILFLDTEGLGMSPTSFDKALLLFSSLVSSRVIYHLSEFIYTEDVSRLFGIVNLIQLYEKTKIEISNVEFPILTWVVQKFTLDSSEAWPFYDGSNLLLSRILSERPNPFNVPSISEFNLTVRTVLKYFGGDGDGDSSHSKQEEKGQRNSEAATTTEPKAFFIPPAIEDSSKFTKLPEMKTSELSPRFVGAMNELRKLILEKTIPKRIGGLKPKSKSKPNNNQHQYQQQTMETTKEEMVMVTQQQFMTGKELADFALSILPAVNEGAGSFLGDRVLDGAGKQLSNLCISQHEKAMEQVSANELPMEEENLRIHHLSSKTNVIAKFESEMIGDESSPTRLTYRLEIEKASERILSGLLSLNELRSSERCENVISFATATLKTKDFAGNLKLFDFEATEVISNATKYSPGPKGGRICENRLRKEIRMMREVIGASEIPTRVLGFIKIGVGILSLSLVIAYSTSLIPGAFQAMAIFRYISKGFAVFGLGLSLISLWSLEGSGGGSPISSSTLVSFIDNLLMIETFIVDNWKVLIPVISIPTGCILLMRPKSISTVSKQLRTTSTTSSISHSHGIPSVFIVENCPSGEFLQCVSKDLFSEGSAPFLVVGWKRMFGLSILPRTGKVNLCCVGQRDDVQKCQRWITNAAIELTGHSHSQKTSATWDDFHVCVLCGECKTLHGISQLQDQVLIDSLSSKFPHLKLH